MGIKVSLLYFSSLSSLNGVSTFIKCIASGFSGYTDVDFSVYSRDTSFSIQKPFTQPQEQGKNRPSQIKTYLHNLLDRVSKKSVLFSFLYAYLIYNRNAVSIVKKKSKKCEDSDIVFFQDFFTAYYYEKKYSQVLEKRARRVMVLHIDGNPLGMLYGYFPRLQRNKISAAYYKSIVLSALGAADAIVLLSQYAKNNFLRHYPQFEHKLSVILNGVEDDENMFNVNMKPDSKDHYNLICVGTVTERKGQDLLIDAVIDLKEELRKRIRMYIVGNGPLLTTLKEKCEMHKLPNVYLEGAQPFVSKYLSIADVFILPSRDEGMPIAIIEALRAGLPIISTNVGGIPDLVINDYNGSLINPNVKELVSVLEKIASGKYNLSKLSRNSRKHYQDYFKSDVMIKNYYNLFYKVLKYDR